MLLVNFISFILFVILFYSLFLFLHCFFILSSLFTVSSFTVSSFTASSFTASSFHCLPPFLLHSLFILSSTVVLLTLITYICGIQPLLIINLIYKIKVYKKFFSYSQRKKLFSLSGCLGVAVMLHKDKKVLG